MRRDHEEPRGGPRCVGGPAASGFMAQLSKCFWLFLGQQQGQVKVECCDVLHLGKHLHVDGRSSRTKNLEKQELLKV